jgi:hypothetical protein
VDFSLEDIQFTLRYSSVGDETYPTLNIGVPPFNFANFDLQFGIVLPSGNNPVQCGFSIGKFDTPFMISSFILGGRGSFSMVIQEKSSS